MPRLSSPIERMKASYDVVVVGSGYGGSVTASRLARAGYHVCVLERGREFQPGDYPDTLGRILGEAQLDTPWGRFFSPAGMYDLRFNEDMSVVAGCGLGGTSLINAGVAIEPLDTVFRDRRWPAEIRADFESGRLAVAFKAAIEMLGAHAYSPALGNAELKKFAALAKVASHLNAEVQRPRICVNFQGPHNAADAGRVGCHRCGDCVSGCNWGAKNTLIMNYLPDALANGAEIYTEVSVRRVERRDGEWDVHYEITGAGGSAFRSAPMTVGARIVVLAAGTLGSTEILLRSRANGAAGRGGLDLSNELGKHFTGNADTVAMAHNTDTIVNAIGTGLRSLDRKEPVGPCITGLIDLRERLGLIIEEGVVPGALAVAVQAVLGAAAVLAGRFEGAHKSASVADVIARWARVLQGAHAGAMRRSFVFLAMGADDANGRLSLEDDRVRVRWPSASRQPIFETVNECLASATVPLRGTFVANPLPLTVHPLGGCRMADDAANGVVNHEGQVFQGTMGTATYETLYVCDGAIIPLPLGVNPLLTITGLAERMCDRLITRQRPNRGARPVTAPPRQGTGVAAARVLFTEGRRPGLQFTERMSGHLVLAGPLPRPRSPLHDAPSIACELTVIANDCERTAMDWKHPATAVGSITADVLSKRPMTVRRGRVSLFTLDCRRVGVRYLLYRLRATSDTGRTYVFTGRKRVRRGSPLHAWSQLTTLYMRIAEMTGGRRIPVARGCLRLTFPEFLRELRTIRTTNTHCFTQRVDASARFLGFFAGMLGRTYSGWLARAELSTGDTPPGHRRIAREQKSYRVSTSDSTSVHLTNYPRRSATKGPILLAPGFSVSATSFAADTVDKNLVDFLGEAGYDVWLLDYRASSDFPEAASEFTVDDVAIRDYPVAISTVLALTGKPTLQIVAHCVGSMALLMALIERPDLKTQVRSVVCSQLGLHPHVPPGTEAKCKLHLGSLLRGLGVEAMTARFDPFEVDDRVLDRILNLLPTRERCTSPTCRRILFLFGESYRHARLSTETHDAIGNWFGVTSMTAMKHIALMVRERQVLDHYGDDVYLPRIGNLRLPISFMHGVLNREFLLAGTEQTYKLLCDTNGRAFYEFEKFPGFGHMDCFIGRNAHRVVFPWILKQLNAGDR